MHIIKCNGLNPGYNLQTMEGLYEALSKGNIEETRENYDKLLAAHPTSGLLWYSYAQFEYRLNNTPELEAIFAGALKNVLDLRLWRLYLQHVRRINRTIPSADSAAIVMKAYEFCLSNIGHDIYSGATWLEYVEWLKGLGMPESDYERQGRIDQLRKVYVRALSIPLDGLEHIWHSYDHFETTHNKVAAKKMLADRSATYMHCRSLVKELKDIVDGIDREWMAVESLEQDERWQDRLIAWMRWIDWERRNSAKLDKLSVHNRVLYAFRRAIACCKYIPEIWMALLLHVEENSSLSTPSDLQPTSLLKQAVEFNPKSLILSFTLIDRLDRACDNTEACKADFESLLSKLTGDRSPTEGDATQYSDQERSDISLCFLQYMQWSRRSSGIAGARAVFARARRHPALLHPVFTASALMEYHVRKDAQVAGKIFELGLGRFGSSPGYLADYARYLIGLNDDQNVRALFERAVNNLLVSNKEAAYGIWCMYLEYELRYGETESIRSLEKRFRDIYPDESPLAMAHRNFSYDPLEVSLLDYRELSSQSADPMTLGARIGRQRSVPFVVGEPLIDLLGRLPLPSKYNGPLLDPLLVLKAISQVRLTGPTTTGPPQTNVQSKPDAKRGERERRRSRSPVHHRDRRR